MRRIEIAPQEIIVARPLPLVFEALCSMERMSPSGSKAVVSIISVEGHKLLMAFSTGGDGRQIHMLKEVYPQPPDRVFYRHLNGPFTGAEERLELHTQGDSTRLVLHADVDVETDSSSWLQRLSLEYAVQDYLQCVKATLATPLHLLEPTAQIDTPEAMLVPLPALHSEEDLLRMVEAQEEVEWGHAGHGLGVARVALTLAEAAMLPVRQIDALRHAALIHDAGKIALSSELWGAGTLNATQRAMMEAHVRLGYDIALRLRVPEAVCTAILYHHERWDGKGYPSGLAGEAIPLRGRILFLAESIDSMLRATYRRPSMSAEQVSAALDAGAGSVWDPTLARRAARVIRGGKSNAS